MNFVALLLVPAPFLLGLNRPLAWTLWACLVVGAWLWRQVRHAPRLANASTAMSGRTVKGAGTVLPVLAILFAVCLPLIQLAGGTCQAIPSTAPCAADPEAAWLGLALSVLLMAWFGLLHGPIRPRTDDILKALALAGGIQAAYALAFHYAGWTPVFMEDVFRHEKVPTGGFTNRNHLAAFLYLSVFATVALILRLPADTGVGRAGRLRALLDQRMFWRLLVVIMVLAVIATRSRAGNAGLVIGLLGGLAWLLIVERRRAKKSSQPFRMQFVVVVVVSVLVLDAVLVGSLVGLDKVQQRIQETSLESEARGDINAALMANPQLFTPLGHGPGSFLPAFTPLKPPDIPLLFHMAHNDYLQALVERGLAGTVLFFLMILVLLSRALRRPPNHGGAEVRFAFVAGTLALLVHATVEYVTQVPVIWMAWIALACVALQPSRLRRG